MPKEATVKVRDAAAILGVSTSTIRNWEKAGKLRASRDPSNSYRGFLLSDIRALGGTEIAPELQPSRSTNVRAIIRSLHRILRDEEGDSSIVERFDEITKLLYCKIADEEQGRGAAGPFDSSDGNVAQRIRESFSRLVVRKAEIFPDRFAHFRLRDRTLVRAAESLRGVSLSGLNLDVKGLAYEELIRNTFDKGDNQQFFTPRPIVEFMVQFLGDRLRGVVCDPACGTGGFLQYAEQWSKAGGCGPLTLLGLEIDQRLAWAAGINLSLHGATGFRVRHLPAPGSLAASCVADVGQVDAVVTNPPFGSDMSDVEALNALALGRGRTNRRRGVLFIERCLDLLKPNGVAAVVIDDGVLNSASTEDVREHIRSRADVIGVVGLPSDAFMPYASVKASILFLQRRNNRQRPKHTFFAEAAKVGRRPNGEPLWRPAHNGGMELDSDLPAILEAWRAGPPVGPSRPDARWFFAPQVSQDGGGTRLDAAFHHPSRALAERALRSARFPLVPLGRICDVRDDSTVPAEQFPDDQITYIGLANIVSNDGTCSPATVAGGTVKSAVRRCLPGDILFAKMRPELRKVCAVPEGVGEAFASSECVVLIPRRSEGNQWIVRPDLLSALLRSDLCYGQLVHEVTGIGRPRLAKHHVLGLRIPVPPPEIQHQVMELFGRRESASRSLRAEAQRAAQEADAVLAEGLQELARSLAGSMEAVEGD